MKPGVALALALMLWAGPVRADDGPVLVMGDSVMAWNSALGRSVGDWLEQALGRDVVKAAVPGAVVAPRGLQRLILGLSSQYEDRAWSWVVLNGGANDLMNRCGCTACAQTLDLLITADGRKGRLAGFLGRLAADGQQVLYVGYYGPSGRGGPFDKCADELDALDARVARLAALSRAIHFIESGDVVSSRNPGDYDTDNTHPSPSGSRRIALEVARAMGAHDPR